MPSTDPPSESRSRDDRSRDDLARRVFGYQHLLNAYAFSLLNSWSEAEDVVQEAILFIDRNPDRYDATRPLLPWARGIVRIKCLNLIRSRRNEMLLDEGRLSELIDDHLDTLWDEDAAAEMAKRIAALRHCMNELPDRACRLLHDFYIDRTPGKDLAERERMNFNNLRSQLHRLRSRLRECVSGRLAEADTAVNEGYWHLLDDYYGQGSGGAAGRLCEAMESGDVPAREVLFFLLDTGAFATVCSQMRPLVAEGSPIRAVAPSVPPANVRPLVSPPKEGPRWSGWAWGGAAAAAIVALLVVGVGKSQDAGAGVVVSASGDVMGVQPGDGTAERLDVGDAIAAGSRIEVGEGGIRIRYHGGRGAEVDLFPSTSAIFGSASDLEANEIRLESGHLQAAVNSQDPRSPLRILTSHAEATVLGTEFVAGVGSLEVSEGRVRLTRLGDGTSVEVGAGQRTVVSTMDPVSDPEPRPEDGMVAHWEFDEFAGSVTADLTGGGHDLEIHEAEWVRGREGGALRLRDQAYAEGRHAPSLAITGELTLAAWVRIFRYGDRAGIVGKYAGARGADHSEPVDRCYALKLQDGRLGMFLSGDGSYEGATIVNGARQLPMDVWMHVAGVYEPGGSVRLYVNGRLDALVTEGVVPAIAQKPAPIYVGTTYNVIDAANFFEGRLDDVRIYERALTPEEIRLLARYR